jgi:hypothetical protein
LRVREFSLCRAPRGRLCEFCACVTTRSCGVACVWCRVPSEPHDVAQRPKLGHTIGPFPAAQQRGEVQRAELVGAARARVANFRMFASG